MHRMQSLPEEIINLTTFQSLFGCIRISFRRLRGFTKLTFNPFLDASSFMKTARSCPSLYSFNPFLDASKNEWTRKNTSDRKILSIPFWMHPILINQLRFRTKTSFNPFLDASTIYDIFADIYDKIFQSLFGCIKDVRFAEWELEEFPFNPFLDASSW